MNSWTKTSFFIFILLFSLSAHSYDYVGEVVKLRGQVTQLRPGERLARAVGLGEELLEDTSVLTGPKSIVIIRMADRSTVTLGPESKLVLVEKPNEQDPGVISLLHGKLRSRVRKKSNSSDSDHKQLISTRSAAMGVRGTDFVAAYNSENRVTALVTLEGEVDMVQIDDFLLEDPLNETRENDVEVERFDGDNIELRSYPTRFVNHRLELKKALSQNTKSIKSGHYSGTVREFKTLTQPVRISPQQFAILYENDEFEEAPLDKATPIDPDFVLPRGVRYAASSHEPLGSVDQENKIFIPKSGGVVDLETGFYVPPQKESPYNEKYNLFTPLASGALLSSRGEFKAPQGLKLDPLKGFVVASARSEDQALLAGQSKQFNESMGTGLIVGDPKSEVSTKSLLSARELMTKNHLVFSLQSVSQGIDYNAGTTARNFDSGGGLGFELLMSHSSGRSWQLLTGASYKNISYKENSFKQENSDQFGLEIGVRRYLTSRLNAVALVGLEQNHFIEIQDSQEELSLVNSTRASLGLEWEALKSSNWSLGFEGNLFRLFSKKTRDLETLSSFGLEFAAKIVYWQSSQNAFELGPRIKMIDQDQDNPGVQGTLERSESGLVFSYKRVF